MIEAATVLPIHSVAVGACVDPPVPTTPKRSGLKHIAHIAAMCLAVGSVVVQCAAIFVAGSVVMSVAGVMAIVVASAVGYRQVTIGKMASLRDIHNKLRDEVNRMTGENNELTNNVNELQTEVTKVEELEGQLAEIAKRGNTDANHLMSLMKENAETMKRQTEIIKAQVSEQILTTILRTDRDQSLTITDREVDGLFMRMKHVTGVTVDEPKMRSILRRNDGSVGSLMQYLRSIGEDEDDGENGITVDLEALHE